MNFVILDMGTCTHEHFFQSRNRNLECSAVGKTSYSTHLLLMHQWRAWIHCIHALMTESASLMLSVSNKESCNCHGHSTPCFRYCVVPIWSKEWRAFGIHNPYTNQSYIHLTEIYQIALARTGQVFLQRSGQVILWLLALLIWSFSG